MLDVRDKEECYSTTTPRIHERIRQHLKFSHNLPLDIAILGWGDYLRESIIPMTLPRLRQGCLARKLGTDVERVELVTGGGAEYTAILDEHLPPAQHLALVCVWQTNAEFRIPASFALDSDALKHTMPYSVLSSHALPPLRQRSSIQNNGSITDQHISRANSQSQAFDY